MKKCLLAAVLTAMVFTASACFPPNLSSRTQKSSARTVRPGIRESEVAAVVAEAAFKHNYELSFPIIATVNGQTLHNHDHSNLIKPGDMLLLDAGAETEMGYAGEILYIHCGRRQCFGQDSDAGYNSSY